MPLSKFGQVSPGMAKLWGQAAKSEHTTSERLVVEVVVVVEGLVYCYYMQK